MRTLKMLTIVVVTMGVGPTSVQANPLGSLVPAFQVNVKETKITNTGSPIVEVYRTKGPEPSDPSSWFERMLDKTGRDKEGKARPGQFVKKVGAEDYAEVEAYTRWLRQQERVGSNMYAVNAFLSFPEGLHCIIRPALSRHDGIVGLLGSVDGGGTWNPGLYVEGKGWGIPFSARQLRADPREFLAVYLDYSNHKKISLFILFSGTKRGIGEQHIPYQFEVTPAMYEPNAGENQGERFDVHNLSLEELVRHCHGISAPWTNVRPREGEQSRVVMDRGRPDVQSDRDSDNDHAHSTTKEADRSAIRRPREQYQDITIEVLDFDGNPVQADTKVEISTYVDNEEVGEPREVVVNGTTDCKVRAGEWYSATISNDRGLYALESGTDDREEEVDGSREKVILRQPDKDGKITFIFRQRSVERREKRAINPSEQKQNPEQNFFGPIPLEQDVVIEVRANRRLPRLRWLIEGVADRDDIVFPGDGERSISRRLPVDTRVSVVIAKSDAEYWNMTEQKTSQGRRFIFEPR